MTQEFSRELEGRILAISEQEWTIRMGYDYAFKLHMVESLSARDIDVTKHTEYDGDADFTQYRLTVAGQAISENAHDLYQALCRKLQTRIKEARIAAEKQGLSDEEHAEVLRRVQRFSFINAAVLYYLYPGKHSGRTLAEIIGWEEFFERDEIPWNILDLLLRRFIALGYVVYQKNRFMGTALLRDSFPINNGASPRDEVERMQKRLNQLSYGRIPPDAALPASLFDKSAYQHASRWYHLSFGATIVGGFAVVIAFIVVLVFLIRYIIARVG